MVALAMGATRPGPTYDRPMGVSTEPTVPARPAARPAAGAGAGLDSYAGASFVQERLRLLGKTVFLLAFGFYVVINGLYVASGADPVSLLTAQHNVMHLLSALIMAALWALSGARPWPMRVLGVFDAVSILLAGVGLAVMAAMPVPDPLMAAILALTVTMMARAVLVPSTAKRTLILSTVAALPVIVVAVVFHQAQAVPGAPPVVKVVPVVTTTLWMVLAVALSTVASHTVYGLRQQIREVSEIGQYTLEEKIGSGGMGEVWRRRHG